MYCPTFVRRELDEGHVVTRHAIFAQREIRNAVFVHSCGHDVATIVGIEEEDLAERRDDMWSFTLNLAETRVATSTLAASVPVDPGVADLTAVPVDGGPQSATAVGPETAGNIAGVVGGGV